MKATIYLFLSALLLLAGCKHKDAQVVAPKVFKVISTSPNPIKGSFTVHVENTAQVDYKVLVYTIYGVELVSKEVHHTEGDCLIDLSSQPRGIYIVSIKTLSNTYTYKVAKE